MYDYVKHDSVEYNTDFIIKIQTFFCLNPLVWGYESYFLFEFLVPHPTLTVNFGNITLLQDSLRSTEFVHGRVIALLVLF